MKQILIPICLIFALTTFAADKPPVSFEVHSIDDNAEMWWARAFADINNDGLLDIALQNNNARGGWLGWLEATDGGKQWQRHIIAETAPNDGTFASGDLEAGDIDGDGDIDIIGVAHPGEWDEGSAPSTVYWYENPSWKAHKIGGAPAFIKDLNLIDFNQDGKLDLCSTVFVTNTLTVFRQDSPDKWTTVQKIKVANLHEGMDAGDIDGDGDNDIAADGYWLESPGGNLEAEWTIHEINPRWHTQDGDWSRNATKNFCRDIDGDGRAEVFISHSERSGYPVAYYSAKDPKKGPWTEHVLVKDLSSAHTLQIFDFDNDGDQDVLTGINMNRAKALELTSFPVYLLINQGDNKTWTKQTLTNEGIYNGQAGDIDGDGDYDIVRLQTHDGTKLEVWMNQTK
ncbi:MAG: VCBS repeat-containing protein [Candidatus Hinthialibacter antarcticus]|nr:VCBS repeat-containing protein [Candidatus Hinthialibacter antarcticus]